jgi:hypothetical protein
VRERVKEQPVEELPLKEAPPTLVSPLHSLEEPPMELPAELPMVPLKEMAPEVEVAYGAHGARAT